MGGSEPASGKGGAVSSQRLWTAVLLVVAAFVAPTVSLILVALTSNSVAVSVGLPDPGPVVRLGLPVVTAVRDVAATVTVGLLVSAATLLPGNGRRRPGMVAALTPLQHHTVVMGALAAGLWAGISLVVLLLTYADLAGVRPDSETAVELMIALPYFVTDFDLGRALGLSLAAALTAGAVAVSATRVGLVGVAAGIALLGVVPLAWTGHTGGKLDHAVAVDSQLVHLLGLTVWVGGLAMLVMNHRRLGELLGVAVGRYSVLAGWCYVFVAAGGVIGASVRVGSWTGLTGTVYGRIVLAKVVLLTLLGLAGWWHRRRLLPRLADARGRMLFLRLVGGELMVMSLAMGFGVALARSAPPESPDQGETPDLATALLGYPMPPPLTLDTVFTAWRPDPLWLALTAVAATAYALAVIRLRRRDDQWPVRRTVSFLLGCSMMIAATCGSPGVYGQVLFSMHMVQHMTMATAIPAFLVLGAPVTLALRALPHRRDGSLGPREWLLAAVHSVPARILTHPLVTVGIFLGSLVGFYYTSALELSLRTHAGHLIMVAHFLVSGYLFANLICGIDPGPDRPPHLFRLLLLIMTFGFHSFFAISLMANEEILAGTWYGSLQRTWGPSLAEDQLLGASLSWALGDYPLAILAAALIVSWINADVRAARQYDRNAERDGDAELAAYNRYLHDLAHRQPDEKAAPLNPPAEQPETEPLEPQER